MKAIYKIKRILNNLYDYQKNDGFTSPLKSNLKRYVIAFTHNKNVDIKVLYKQFKKYNKIFNNITIGGWYSKEGDYFLDIGTTTDSLKEARILQKNYNQIAIFDLEELKEL